MVTEPEWPELSPPAAYERFWVSALMRVCARHLVADADVRPGDRVLDVACGTGIVARTAAALVGGAGDVVGADLNGELLDAAEQLAHAGGPPAITWRQCEAATMPFPDDTFDVVVCQQGLQFMPDRPAALREMLRVLASGGRFAASVWKGASPMGIALRTALDASFGAGATATWNAAWSMDDRDELRSLVAAAGFRSPRVRLDFKTLRHPSPGAFVQGALAASPNAEDVAALPPTERAKLVDSVLGALTNFVDDFGLAVPVQCHTVTAEK